MLVVGLLPSTMLADVPPDPGFTRQPADLILETEGDLSAYRFFLEMAVSVEEIKFTDGRKVIEAANRGGAMRFGKLIAVPLKDMSAISGDLSGPLLESHLRQKKFPNAKELISHGFQQTISIAEKPLWKDPVYKISAVNGEITATKVSGGTGAGVVSRSTEYLWPIVIVSGAVAVLFTLAIVALGVWLFRRKKKKV
jgi:hypothetical protein